MSIQFRCKKTGKIVIDNNFEYRYCPICGEKLDDYKIIEENK